MARKTSSFYQLLEYIHKPEKETATLTHNLYTEDGNNWHNIAKEFQENNRYLSSRKNGNALYHEVIVFEAMDYLSKAQQSEKLLDIAKRYLMVRAPEQLAYGRVHLNTDHVHVHLMLSSNGPRSAKRERLTKAQFRTIQSEIEAYQVLHYPELGKTRLYEYDKPKTERIHVGIREYEATKRTGIVSAKDQLHLLLYREMSTSRSQKELVSKLTGVGYFLYQRGKTWGVENNDTGRRHRLKTIGLDDTFQEVQATFTLRENRHNKLASLGISRIEEEANREISDFGSEDERCLHS